MNRNEYDVDGHQIELKAEEGLRYFDLYHGTELEPDRTPDGKTVLSFAIEAHGFGALLATKTAPSGGIQALCQDEEMTRQAAGELFA